MFVARRNFTEHMRALGYPRLISHTSFANPNFELVADCLYWLVKRYDPEMDISDDISTEPDRIFFLTTVATVMYNKAHLKLNPRKLYAADGDAVGELLKLSALLYSATELSNERGFGSGDDHHIDLGSDQARLSDLQTARTLASEITSTGAELYEMLGGELELREARTKALSRPLEMDATEKYVRAAVGGLKSSASAVNKQLASIDDDEANLAAKIEKKKMELERSQKRLKSLAEVRPAYMDEYEALEKELAGQYAEYLERFRNQQYLEGEVDALNAAEADQVAAETKMLDAQRAEYAEKLKNQLRMGSQVGFDGGEDGEFGMEGVGEAGSNNSPPSSGSFGAGRDRMEGDAPPGHAPPPSRPERGAVFGGMGDFGDDDDSDGSVGTGGFAGGAKGGNVGGVMGDDFGGDGGFGDEDFGDIGDYGLDEEGDFSDNEF